MWRECFPYGHLGNEGSGERKEQVGGRRGEGRDQRKERRKIGKEEGKGEERREKLLQDQNMPAFSDLLLRAHPLVNPSMC